MLDFVIYPNLFQVTSHKVALRGIECVKKLSPDHNDSWNLIFVIQSCNQGHFKIEGIQKCMKYNIQCWIMIIDFPEEAATAEEIIVSIDEGGKHLLEAKGPSNSKKLRN